jgi:hypothetical protein
MVKPPVAVMRIMRDVGGWDARHSQTYRQNTGYGASPDAGAIARSFIAVAVSTHGSE